MWGKNPSPSGSPCRREAEWLLGKVIVVESYYFFINIIVGTPGPGHLRHAGARCIFLLKMGTTLGKHDERQIPDLFCCSRFVCVVQISCFCVTNLCTVCANTHPGWLRTLNSLVGRSGASVCWLVCRRCSQVCTEIAPQYAGWHPDGLANLSQKWSHKSSHSMRIGISADAVICTEIAP